MKKEIDHKKDQKSELQKLQTEKTNKEKERKSKKDLHENILPSKAQKLQEDALELVKICEIKEYNSIEPL